MKRVVYLYITREDFLSIKSLEEGGTVLDGRRYALLRKHPDSEQQLADIGKPNKTGEGVISKVFFFEYENCAGFSDVPGVRYPEALNLRLVSAEIVDRYETQQELQKELSLIKAKIKLNDKEIGA